MNQSLRSLFASACLSTVSLVSPALAADLVTAELRPGWRLADGRHVAGLHLTLADGWKTYWRAPGDAGIPPLFDWSGSRNLGDVSITWPTPHVFWQSGMRSIGYTDEVLLPLIVQPGSAADVRLEGQLDVGVCRDICIPVRIRFSGDLPVTQTQRDAGIAAALSDVPFTAREASVASVTCTIRAEPDAMILRAEIRMPSAGGTEATVIEAGNPMVWVAEPVSHRSGDMLVTEARMMHMNGGAFAVDRSAVRITVLGRNHAVDIQGCG